MPADWLNQEVAYMDPDHKAMLRIQSGEDLGRRIKSLAVQVCVNEKMGRMRHHAQRSPVYPEDTSYATMTLMTEAPTSPIPHPPPSYHIPVILSSF